MDLLQNHLKQIRFLAAKALKENYGVNLKLVDLPSKKPLGDTPTTVFGVPIQDLEQIRVEIAEGKVVSVPKVFHELCNFVKKDLRIEGLFRVEGSKKRQQTIIDNLDLNRRLTPSVTIVDASAVIKSYLRNLPNTVIPKDFTMWFIEANKATLSKNALLLAVLLLPLEHIHFLAYLMHFCHEVTKYSEQNKMNAHNIAVVMSPNIFHQLIDLQLAPKCLQITKILIENADRIGEVPPSIQNRLRSEPEVEAGSKCCCEII